MSGVDIRVNDIGADKSRAACDQYFHELDYTLWGEMGQGGLFSKQVKFLNYAVDKMTW